MAKSSNPSVCPHSGIDHLVRNVPFESKTWMRRFKRVGYIYFVIRRIDGDRTKAFELSIATSLAAPTRKDLTIGAELDDSIVTRINDIYRIIRANGNLRGRYNPGLPTRAMNFPYGSELLYAVLGADLRDVNVTGRDQRRSH